MCAWVKMTREGAVLSEKDAVIADGVRILSELPDRFAGHHGDGKRDIDTARAGLHRDRQSRVSRLVDRIRHACGFAAEQQYVAGGEGEIGVGGRGFGRQQHQPPRFASAPVFEGVPVDMPGKPRHFEIVHAGPFQRAVGEWEARRFDDIDAKPEASGEAQDCSGIAGDVRLVEGDAETVVHFRVFLVHGPENRFRFSERTMHQSKVSERPLRVHWTRGALISGRSATAGSPFWKFLDLRVAIFCEVRYTPLIVNLNRWRGEFMMNMHIQHPSRGLVRPTAVSVRRFS
ncbi:hypothetical protein MESS4_830081 [Mesorhizobium sp. STM 4661]|nr:hypothetical protein MESS4_830081 [Mesorhizobium sp. STM 4661]